MSQENVQTVRRSYEAFAAGGATKQLDRVFAVICRSDQLFVEVVCSAAHHKEKRLAGA